MVLPIFRSKNSDGEITLSVSVWISDTPPYDPDAFSPKRVCFFLKKILRLGIAFHFPLCYNNLELPGGLANDSFSDDSGNAPEG